MKRGSIHQCNCCLGCKTLHPLVSVVELSGADPPHHDIQFDFYTLLLREHPVEGCLTEEYQVVEHPVEERVIGDGMLGEHRVEEYSLEEYKLEECSTGEFPVGERSIGECPVEEYPVRDKEFGCQCYDYSAATLLFLKPGHAVFRKKNLLPHNGWMLAFHPDLISGTSLGMNISDYTFFSYLPGEALHLSLREKRKVIECLDALRQELQHAVDRHSRILISKQIELLLDYCTRFYERQLITRWEADKKLITKLNKVLDNYFETDRPRVTGLPSTEYCATLLHLSNDYFQDLLKFETGKTIHEYISFKRLDIAKKWLLTTDKSVRQIASELGYSSSRFFGWQFKKLVGCLPEEYKRIN